MNLPSMPGAAVAIEQLLFKWRPSDAGEQPVALRVNLGISARGSDYPRSAFGIFTVVVATAAAVGIANLRRGRSGVAWLAVRSNERAAAAAGVDVVGAKLSAFALSSLLAGLGGVLLTYQRLTLTTDSFAVFLSLATLALTYLAGIASVSGAVLAGVLTPLGVFAVISGQDPVRVSPYSFVVNGALLVGVALVYPDGLTGAATRLARWGARRWGSAGRGEASELRSDVAGVE